MTAIYMNLPLLLLDSEVNWNQLQQNICNSSQTAQLSTQGGDTIRDDM